MMFVGEEVCRPLNFHSPLSESGSDLLAGGFSGVVCATAGYPLETVIVMIQSRRHAAAFTYRECVQQLYRSAGVRRFYKGMTPRLLAAGLDNALTFAGYAAALRLVGASEDSLSLADIGAGGVGGGLATTLVLTPLELVKCRLQVYPHAAANVVSGGPSPPIKKPLCVRDCMWHVYHYEGGICGFYQGGAAMLMREVPGTALWCGTNGLLRAAITPTGSTVDDLGLWETILCGGVSGLVYSVFLYPVDVLKTRIQTDPKRYRQRSFAKIAQEQYRQGGLRSFYRGFGLVALCSFPSSALAFATYECALQFFAQGAAEQPHVRVLAAGC